MEDLPKPTCEAVRKVRHPIHQREKSWALVFLYACIPKPPNFVKWKIPSIDFELLRSRILGKDTENRVTWGQVLA